MVGVITSITLYYTKVGSGKFFDRIGTITGSCRSVGGVNPAAGWRQYLAVGTSTTKGPPATSGKTEGHCSRSGLNTICSVLLPCGLL